MKTIDWVDDRGRKRRSLVKDTDGIEAAQYGIPVEPPDIRNLDWDAVIKEIEDKQFEHRMYDWQQAQQSPAAIQECINVFKRHFIRLYKLSQQEDHKK